GACSLQTRYCALEHFRIVGEVLRQTQLFAQNINSDRLAGSPLFKKMCEFLAGEVLPWDGRVQGIQKHHVESGTTGLVGGNIGEMVRPQFHWSRPLRFL